MKYFYMLAVSVEYWDWDDHSRDREAIETRFIETDRVIDSEERVLEEEKKLWMGDRRQIIAFSLLRTES